MSFAEPVRPPTSNVLLRVGRRQAAAVGSRDRVKRRQADRTPIQFLCFGFAGIAKIPAFWKEGVEHFEKASRYPARPGTPVILGLACPPVCGALDQDSLETGI